MSLRDYELGSCMTNEFDENDFYGVIQCAMRLADSDNLEKLKNAFPEVWADLQLRYNAPGGRFETD